MSATLFMIGLVLGLVAGYLFRKYTSGEELNTDACMDFLNSRGYYVKLSLRDQERK